MGDEAIHQAIQGARPDLELFPLPLGLRGAARSLPRLPALSGRRVLLGGGTVVGRRIWRLHLLQALALTRGGAPFMIGAGVEDPSFQRPGHLSERHELRRWRRLLHRFERVTVRGPRSAQLLNDAGIEAEVVGDPALLLDPTGPVPRPAADLIGINLGVSDDLWGHDQDQVVEAVAGAVRALGRSGWRFRSLVVNESDLVHADRCRTLSGVGPERWETVVAVDPTVYLNAVGACRLVIAERLHAAILAARMAVPIVMLEYQPKCRDFLESVGLDQFGIRTDRLASGALLELIEQVTAVGSPFSALLDRRVNELRGRLAEEMALLP
jgi:polysaccharide pyruvyl transferase WcaK-like protein